MDKLTKVLRFIRIYGVGKTLFKVVGRARAKFGWYRSRMPSMNADIGVLGCGQFAFATVGYSLKKHYGNRFVDCYDIDVEAQRTFAEFYRIESPSRSGTELIENNRVHYVYVTSNHASHTDYAIQALLAGKTVYIEKPIAVTREQLARLHHSVSRAESPIYAGYNRPFSGAIRDLRRYIGVRKGALTMNCFVSGHKIPVDHWYRDPAEGTRICGNVGHWLDLAVHVLSWSELPDRWDIRITYSSESARDDDLSISLTSSHGDLVVVVLTARCEPFEGINETINIQQDETICKIDDFRKMTIWQGRRLIRRRYWPKDVGHEAALCQPFDSKASRDWEEVEKSTLLMLKIADMVKNGDESSSFSFKKDWMELTNET